jgi:hypothetical protein
MDGTVPYGWHCALWMSQCPMDVTVCALCMSQYVPYGCRSMSRINPHSGFWSNERIGESDTKLFNRFITTNKYIKSIEDGLVTFKTK